MNNFNFPLFKGKNTIILCPLGTGKECLRIFTSEKIEEFRKQKENYNDSVSNS